MRFLFFCLCMLLASFVEGQHLVTINTPNEIVNIAPSATYIEDAKGELTINDIIQRDTTISFLPITTQSVEFGVSSSFFWIEAKLRNETNEGLLLKIGTHTLTDLLVYEINDG